MNCSRMAGNFDGSLVHYRAALKIDPDFVSSQLGLGDTYALMGNQEQARVEYDKAIRFAHTEADRLTYGMQKAMTFVRDGNYAEADKEFLEIAETAHAKEHDLQEAQALRHMAEYQADDNVALKHLKLAEESLSHRVDHLRLGSRRRVVAHSAQRRGARRARRESAPRRQVAATTRGDGQRQPQPRDPELVSRCGWNSADGPEEI